MRRKPCLALSARVPSDGVSTASRVTWMEVDDPLRGASFLFSNTSALQTASLGRGNYDTLRYRPISERSLFSFFGGPFDISFNSSA